MKKLNIIILIILSIIGCNKKTVSPNNLLLGDWVGKFGEEQLNLTFKGDSSLTIFYFNQNRKILVRFKQINDKLILSQSTSDTCYILKLDKNNLVLRPIEKYKEDVDLIFLIDFKRLN